MPKGLVNKLLAEDSKTQNIDQKTKETTDISTKSVRSYIDDESKTEYDKAHDQSFQFTDLSVDLSTKCTKPSEESVSLNDTLLSSSSSIQVVLEEVKKLREIITVNEIEKFELNQKINQLNFEKGNLTKENKSLKETNTKLSNKLALCDKEYCAHIDELFNENNFDEAEILKHVIKALDQITTSFHSGKPINIPVLTPSLNIADQDEVDLARIRTPDHSILIPCEISNTEFKPFKSVINLRNDITEMMKSSKPSKDKALEKLKSELNTIQQEKAALESKHRALESQNASLNSKYTKLSEDFNKKLEIENKKTEQYYESTIQEYEEQISTLSATTAHLKNKNYQMTISESKGFSTLQYEVDSTRKKLAFADKEIKRLQAKVDEYIREEQEREKKRKEDEKRKYESYSNSWDD